MQEEVQYLTEKEVSEMTRIPLSTLRNQRHLGIGFPYLKISRSVRYSWADVVNFMEARKIQPMR